MEHARENEAINTAKISDSDKTVYRTQLALYPEASRFRLPNEPALQFELLSKFGVEELHNLQKIYSHQGDGGYFASQLLVAYARAKKGGAKELKEFIHTHDVEAMTKLGYAYKSFAKKAGNLLSPKDLTPQDIGTLVDSLRFEQLAKVITAAGETWSRLGDLVEAHGLKKLIHFAKTKSAEEITAMAKEARGDEGRKYYATSYPADPELAKTIEAPPFDEVMAMVNNLGDGGLTVQDAKRLHAIVERHLSPSYTGETPGGGYNLDQMNQFWDRASPMGPTVLTPEHIGLYNTLQTAAGRNATLVKDLQARLGKMDIMAMFKDGVASSENADVLIGTAGRAIASAIEGHGLEAHYQARHDKWSDGKFNKLFNPPGPVAALLETLGDSGATKESINAAVDAVQKPYRSLKTTVNGERKWHRLSMEVPLGGGDDMGVSLSTSKGSIDLHIQLPGMGEGSHGAFAEVQTFGDGGARYSLGGALLDSANPAAKRIGAKLFTEVMVRSADNAIAEQTKDSSSYQKDRFVELVSRSAKEVLRLPQAELHQKVGDIATPAETFAKLATAAGFDVGTEPLDAPKIAELGARVRAGGMLRVAKWHTKQISEGAEVRTREILERFGPSLDALTAMPIADRFAAQGDEPSIGEAFVVLAQTLGIETTKDPKTDEGWQELTKLAIAAHIPSEENMLVWAATTLKSDRGVAKLKGTLAELGHLFEGLSDAALENNPAGGKMSPAQAIRSMAAAAELDVAADAPIADVLAAARELPERRPISQLMAETFERSSDIYLRPS